jgi:hypothetical protein
VAQAEGWEAAFVAMSVALGARVEEACLLLDAGAAARASPFARALANTEKHERAKALAVGLARIAVAIERARLA